MGQQGCQRGSMGSQILVVVDLNINNRDNHITVFGITDVKETISIGAFPITTEGITPINSNSSTRINFSKLTRDGNDAIYQDKHI